MLVSEAKGKAKGKNDRDLLEALVGVLGRLVLINSADIRELCGACYYTFLVPEECGLAKAMMEAGEEYNSKVKAMKEQKNEKGDEDNTDLASLGPPFLHVWAALVEHLAKEGSNSAHDREIFIKYWNERVTKLELDDLGNDVRLCRIRRPQRQGKDKRARLQFALDTRVAGIEDSLVRAVKAQGGVRKVGPAPRGNLEREAKRLLEKMS